MQSPLSTYHIVSWGEDGRQKPNTYLMGWSEVHRGAQRRLFIVTWGHCSPPLIPRLSFCMAWWNLSRPFVMPRMWVLPSSGVSRMCMPPTHRFPVAISFNKPTVTVSQYLHSSNPPPKIYLKFDELFLSGNLQILIFLDSSWLSVAKIVESELADKKRHVYFL